MPFLGGKTGFFFLAGSKYKETKKTKKQKNKKQKKQKNKTKTN